MTSSASKEALIKKIQELEEANQRLETRLSQYRSNEERWQKLLQSSRDGYFELNLKGDLVFFNDAVCRGLGYPREELMGMNNREYTSPETARYMYQVFHQVYETGVSAEISDYEIITKDGEIRYLEISAYLLHDAEGNPVGFGGVSRDVTERRRTEQALRESEERFRQLQEATFGGIVVHDKARVVDCNAELCRMSGYAYEELIGNDGSRLFAPEWRNVLKKHLDSNEESEYDIVGLRKDGSRIPLEVRSKIIPYAGQQLRVAELRDITQRKKTEEALRKSRVRYRELYKEAHQAEELYQSLLDSSPDAIVLFNVDQTIEYTNQAFGRMFGWDEQTLEKKPAAYIPRPQRESFYAVVREIIETGRPVQGKEGQGLTRDGRFLDVSISAARYLDYKGYPAGVLIIFRDITDTKRYQWHMHQAQKMESIGTMAGGIAHDFNNLLMGIQGRLSLAVMQTEPQSRLCGHLKEIESYAMRAADLTHKLLGFARSEKGELLSTDINDLVHTQIRMFGRTCKSITIKENLTESLCNAMVDARQIDQVLLNMFVNACHAMPEGGNLYIETATETLPEERTAPHDLEAGSYVRISVTDSGVGMDAAVQRRVFEPFFTTKPKGEGTGLGLASAFTIIKNHGGFITLYSEVGRGTTFNIYLPATEASAALQAEIENEIIHGEGTILLVDDEEMIADVAREMLSQLGYAVIVAGSGAEAIERLTENSDSVMLVILDLIMPDMNGSEAFEQLKALQPDLKVLLASGYSLNGQAESLMQQGCNGYIQKPFNLTELSRKLYEILNDSA